MYFHAPRPNRAKDNLSPGNPTSKRETNDIRSRHRKRAHEKQNTRRDGAGTWPCSHRTRTLPLPWVSQRRPWARASSESVGIFAEASRTPPFVELTRPFQLRGSERARRSSTRPPRVERERSDSRLAKRFQFSSALHPKDPPRALAPPSDRQSP